MIEASEANPTPSPATLAPEMPMGEKTNTTSIKLLIKASNQQHDDQIIESDLMWTVFRLKTQLSLVYPSKPPVTEQKLIYSGQLLNDRAQLKDIIRSYKDVYTQNHILHLVYTPKNQIQPTPNNMTTPAASTTTTAASSGNSGNSNYSNIAPDGLRQRHNANGNSNSNIDANANQNWQQQQQQLFAMSNNMNSGANLSFPGAFDMQAAQQAAMYNWMWQTYGQYMQQISQMNAAQTSRAAATTNSTAQLPPNPINPVIAYPNGFYPQAYFGQFPFQAPQMPATAAAAAATATIPTAATTTAAVPAQPVEQQPAAAAAVEPAAAPPQPRFPNFVQEEQENRDWLESLCSIMRLAFFLTILYFNSSPMRCLVVFIIAGGIYLYHIGFFRTRQERNNNDINRINNAAAAAVAAAALAPNQQQQQPQQQQPQQAAGEADAAAAADNAGAAIVTTDVNGGAAADAASTAAQDASIDNNSTTVIAFMRSFIVSFFTSLLPEAPAAL